MKVNIHERGLTHWIGNIEIIPRVGERITLPHHRMVRDRDGRPWKYHVIEINHVPELPEIFIEVLTLGKQ